MAKKLRKIMDEIWDKHLNIRPKHLEKWEDYLYIWRNWKILLDQQLRKIFDENWEKIIGRKLRKTFDENRKLSLGQKLMNCEKIFDENWEKNFDENRKILLG